MRKIASTILCFSIAMILLFFGTSFDKADLIFYTPNDRVVTVESVAVYSGGASISEVETVMPQTVSAKDGLSAGQLLSRLSSGKKEVKEILLMIPVVFASENNSNSDRAIFVMKSPDIYYRVAVLNYIHDLDGKKRI